MDRSKIQTFVWGKMGPGSAAASASPSTSPFCLDELSKKEMHHISAATEGSHCLGVVGVGDWCFVWGEAQYVRVSTAPLLLPSLKREKVMQTCCSARHSLCITRSGGVYGWGEQALTLLGMDTNVATPLLYLNGKGVQCLAACNTHSVAYNTHSANVYAFGLCGSWLGFDDDDESTSDCTSTFGVVKLDAFVYHHSLTVAAVDCASHYTLVLLSNGCVGCCGVNKRCGVNKHGRMGAGSAVHQSSRTLWTEHLYDIVRISAAPLHAGFVTASGRVFTCGNGGDNRLGHGDTTNVYIPKLVHAMRNVKVREIECVAERSYVVSTSGHLFLWGRDPCSSSSSKQTHFSPFVYRAPDSLRVFNVTATQEFCLIQTMPVIRDREGKCRAIRKNHCKNGIIDEQSEEGTCQRRKQSALHHAYRRRTEQCNHKRKDHV